MTTKKLSDRYVYAGPTMSGGLGDVLVCNDTNLERKVAIKFIQDKMFSSLMKAEIKTLQSIRSKHVVEIYDLILSSNEIGLVQEYLPGDDLTVLVPKPPEKPNLSSGDFLKAIFQIASGVSDIHQADIVHRDVKLNNMKFSAEKLVKLFDFGFAKIAKSEVYTLGFKGTAGYAAPELYISPAKISKAIDVYAVGICAWYLATGGLPPELQGIPPNPIKSLLEVARPDIPKPVLRLLDRCVAYQADKRPVIEEVTSQIASFLVAGKHRGVLCSSSERYILDDKAKALDIKGPLGAVTISYSGIDFEVKLKSGNVFLNDVQIAGTMKLPGASVLVFGDEALGPRRQMFTFDVSRPEVIL
jgi:serine/threonine-protein kinase